MEARKARDQEFYPVTRDHDYPSSAIVDYRRVSCELYQSYNHLIHRLAKTFTPPPNITNSLIRLFRTSTNGVAGLLCAQKLPCPWPPTVINDKDFTTLLHSLMESFHMHNNELILGMPSDWAPATQNYTDLCVTLARLTATLNYADFENRNKNAALSYDQSIRL
jgi:hypothetical protein